MTSTVPKDATDLLPTRWSLLTRLKRADDQEGWQKFFDSYWRLIYGVARKTGLTDAEAQDAVQETVITVSKHIGEFRYDPARCSFKSWLLLIARQRISRQFAKRQGRPAPQSGAMCVPAAAVQACSRRAVDDTARTSTMNRVPDPAGPDLEAVWDQEWQKHALKVATERLKEQVKAEQYQIFDLYVLQGWSARDVAHTLQVGLGQVYLTKHRLSKLLKQELKRASRGAM